jgi:predicted nucleotidyltransferase
MIQKYGIWKVLRVFFDDPQPREGFTIRYISRNAGLATTSVRLHLEELCKEVQKGYPLVIKGKGISYPTYRANRESGLFRFYKRMDMLFRLENSGLLERLWEELSPKAIVLFGSASRGEDVKESDVDIFILAKERRIELGKYESGLKRNISLHFAGELNELPKELRNNVINGAILRGYLKVF